MKIELRIVNCELLIENCELLIDLSFGSYKYE